VSKHSVLTRKRIKAIGGLICLLLWPSLSGARHLTVMVNDAFLNYRPVSQASGEKSGPVEVVELKQGLPIERDMKGGETHGYEIALTAGQYLKVVVEQKGIDVVVGLFAPDGQKLMEMDSPNGMQGPEAVDAIAEAAGRYRLEVKSPDKKAAPGRYEAKVEELRESTGRDRDRAAAERAVLAGEQLAAQGTAVSLRQATEKFNEALSSWRKAEDRHGEAKALNSVGLTYYKLGENQKALESYNQAVGLWRAMGDHRGEALTLHGIGLVYVQAGDNQKALEYYNQALPLWREVGDRQAEANTLGSIGVAYNRLGKLQEALDYFNQSLTMQRALGDRRNEATILTSMSVSYSRMGELQKALEYGNQALPLIRAAGDRRVEAAALHNVGAIYWQLGDAQKALEYYNQALPLRRATGDPNGEFSTLYNIGLAHLSLGDPQKALDSLNYALSLVRTLKDEWGEARTLQSIGVVYSKLSEPLKALESLNQALPRQRALGDRLGEAITLSNIGAGYASLGKREEALDYLQKALLLHRSLGDRGNEAATLTRIARVERDRGHFDEARTQIETALNIVERTRSQVVSQDLRASYLALNQDYYEFYIDLLMSMHREHPTAGHDAAALQVCERARARSLLEILIEGRADIKQGAQPLLLARERSSQQQLTIKAERLTRLLSSKHTGEQETAYKKEVENALEEYQEIQSEIRSRSPRYASLTQPEPLSLKEIQQKVLDKDTLLLEYALGEERSYLWAVTPGSMKTYELPGRRAIEAVARRVNELLVARADGLYPEALATLSQILLGPVADDLVGKRLLIVTEGILQYVPFSALSAPVSRDLSAAVNSERSNGPARTTRRNRPGSERKNLSASPNPLPLVVDHEIVSLPSASVIEVLRRELGARRPAPKTVAVLADPVFDKDDERVRSNHASQKASQQGGIRKDVKIAAPASDVERSSRELGLNRFDRLLLSRREAELITGLASRGGPLMALDFAASRATATNPEIGQYQIVHLATHSLINNQHPELSGIVLSLVDEEGRSQDGFLRLYEIYNLKLNADLVVLSACQTALGKDIRGEGLVGLTRGFMYAGVPRVVASLWKVSDKATAELMMRFYQRMLRDRLHPAAALRSAQVSMLKEKQWSAAYYWAGFVIQGEWQ
jgi:CHAT domain-containing protein/Tfp pilus assembly protein PilF